MQVHLCAITGQSGRLLGAEGKDVLKRGRDEEAMSESEGEYGEEEPYTRKVRKPQKCI